MQVPIGATERPSGHGKITLVSGRARRAPQRLGGSHGGKLCWDDMGKPRQHASMDQIPGEGKAGGGRGPQTFQTPKKP